MARELLWLDLEMTGLDSNYHDIVEIATVITDAHLEVIAKGPDLVVHAHEGRLERMGDYVHEMHQRSGLLDEIRASELTLAEAEEQTLSFIDSHLPQDYRPPMCGNSIGTDRRFLEVQMPKLENRCHYRVVDVSSIKELAWRWYPKAMKQAPSKLEAHRARGDILESIAELKFYRAQFMQPPESA
jgi:oligoribonuclease